MSTIYENVIEQASQGARICVNFKRHTLSVNGKFVKLKGVDTGIPQYDNLDAWLDAVEDLYDNYKYSKPSKKSINRERKAKFKALSVSELISELGHEGLGNPETRNVAQAKLEVFILLSLINGSFNPEELFAKDWFYQGADKSFIMRKDWF